jgi:TP901 family phage tail tape measure protein
MRPFTVKTEIVAVDKASSEMNKINAAAQKLTGNVTKESNVAGNTFKNFGARIGMATKQASVSLGNFNARVSQVSRNVKKKFDDAFGSLGKLGIGIGLAAAFSGIITANIQVDKSLASLSAVTGVSGAAFENYKVQVFDASKQMKMFSGDMAAAFERIGSQKPELLADAEAMKRVTIAAVVLSKASREELEPSADNLTGIMNQFALGADNAERAINVLAAGTIAGASSIAETGEAMKNFGTVAKTANMSIEESVAAIQLLSLYQIKSAEAGTKARGAINQLQKAGIGYKSGLFNTNDALLEAKSKYDKLGSAIKKDALIQDIFGAENKTAGLILMQNVGRLQSMTKEITGTSAATEMASKNSDTFSNRLTEIKNSFLNVVTGVQANTGEMGKFKNMLFWVADNMSTIISVALKVILVFAAIKGAMIAARIAQYTLNAAIFVYNVILGVQAALIGSCSIAMKGNTVAIWVMNAATKAMAIGNAILSTSFIGVTAATWAFVAALWATGIPAIVIGIAALGVGIYMLVKHFDVVKKAVVDFFKMVIDSPITKFLLWPLFLTIEVIKKLQPAILAIKTVFVSVFSSIKGLIFNVIDWFKAIGNFIGAGFIYAYNKIMDGFINPFIAGVKSVFSWIVDNVSIAVSSVIEFGKMLISPFMPIIDFFVNLGKVIEETVIGKFKEIGAFVVKIIDTVSNFFKSSTAKINAKTEEIVAINVKHENDNKVNNENKTALNTVKNKEIVNEKTINKEQIKSKDTSKLIASLDKNTEEIKIQNAQNDQWKGKFYTSILKDANVSEKGMTIKEPEKLITDKNITKEQRLNGFSKPNVSKSEIEFIKSGKADKIFKDKINEINNVSNISNETFKKSEIANTTNKENIIESEKNISKEKNISNETFKNSEIAKTSIKNEENIVNTQKEVLNDKTLGGEIVNDRNISDKKEVNMPVAQSSRRQENKKNELIIKVVDNTGNKFSIEVESTGIDVIRTGNA